jgi:hypothetical protein
MRVEAHKRFLTPFLSPGMEAERSQLGKPAFYRYEVYSVARMDEKSESLRLRGR